MPREKLTIKQEAFAIAYLETGNASEAYRRAYNADKMSPEAIRVEAHKVLKSPNVAKRVEGGIARIQLQGEAKALLSLEEHMEELKVLRELAKSSNQMSAAITAEVKRGELRKFYIKQIETGEAGEFDRLSDAELDSLIAAEAKDLLGATKRGRTEH